MNHRTSTLSIKAFCALGLCLAVGGACGGRAVTVEEGWQYAGIGAEIAARIMEKAFDYLDAPVARVSAKDVPMPYAANLEKLALPSVAELVEAVKAVTYR